MNQKVSNLTGARRDWNLKQITKREVGVCQEADTARLSRFFSPPLSFNGIAWHKKCTATFALKNFFRTKNERPQLVKHVSDLNSFVTESIIYIQTKPFSEAKFKRKNNKFTRTHQTQRSANTIPSVDRRHTSGFAHYPFWIKRHESFPFICIKTGCCCGGVAKGNFEESD